MSERLPPSGVKMTALMCGAETLSMTGFAAFTTLLPQLQRDWALSNSEAGLIGGTFFAGYMAAVPLLAGMTDRVDSRRVYFWACMLSAIGAAGFRALCAGLVDGAPPFNF